MFIYEVIKFGFFLKNCRINIFCHYEHSFSFHKSSTNILARINTCVNKKNMEQICPMLFFIILNNQSFLPFNLSIYSDILFLNIYAVIATTQATANIANATQ